MSLLLDLTLAGSRIATGVGVALIAVAVAALVLVAFSGRRQPVEEPTAVAPPISETASWRHRRTSRRSARPVVRHPAVDESTQVLPALRDQTELIPRIGGGRRG